jgi:hypothetical protein
MNYTQRGYQVQGFHGLSDQGSVGPTEDSTFTYTFETFFHPYVGALMQLVNQAPSLGTFFDPSQWSKVVPPSSLPAWYRLPDTTTLGAFYPVASSPVVQVDPMKMTLDVDLNGGSYATYNWELFFHLPVAVAVHLSKNQRFAEAQRWFHYVFDPTSPSTDPNVGGADRYWKFLAFRTPSNPTADQQAQQLIAHRTIAELIALLSKPAGECTPAEVSAREAVLRGYQEIADSPFRPHAVARTRTVAYQYYVVMKYLDNLIAWGDSLFAQDTIETLNEATLLYVLAANLLGPRPTRLPAQSTTAPLCYNDFKRLWRDQGTTGTNTMSNALVEIEGQFPFNWAPPPGGDGGGGNSPLFGIGNTLYFCVPPNSKLLGYWDTVSDRLFKLRNCMNLQGIVQKLPLFDPPLDPGMLVKAMAAGIDVGSAVSGLNQPLGPVRAMPWIQKASELANEVRALGSALLSAFEKGDAEQLALLRQGHEVTIQKMALGTRFLQWQQARAATESLLKTRASALERYAYYQRLLGLTPDPSVAPATLALDHPGLTDPVLTEENFDSVYNALVAKYDLAVPVQPFLNLPLATVSSPSAQSGASGPGNLYLNINEDSELNTLLPTARDTRLAASIAEVLAGVLTFIPEFNLNLAFWGVGGTSKVFGGSKASDAIKIGAEILRTVSAYQQDQAGIASKTASYQRRADEWVLQSNLAARELVQIGRQILGSLIAERVAQSEYQTAKQQVDNAQAVNSFLGTKFTNADLYQWMQGELSSLYYQYYRFALDTARKAERTMKQELMRPEVDATSYVQTNYWDGGRQGLLSGDRLHFDVKRLEAAYLDNNARELELTRHVSLRRLDPFALLTLRITGSCQVKIPEWLYDLDCPGHYLRRLKSVSLSIPAVVGPYQGVNCTLTLLQSSIRRLPRSAGVDYRRRGSDDPDFVDYPGTGQQIVTSSGNGDSGLFETNLRDERFLPFEGAGAESTWRLDLPDVPSFDYTTIADVVLHVRYTARQGGDELRAHATQALTNLPPTSDSPNLFLLFSLRHDFPSEWATRQANSIQLTLTKAMFPYAVQRATLSSDGTVTLFAAQGGSMVPARVSVTPWVRGLVGPSGSAAVTIQASVLSASVPGDVYMLLPYTATLPG